jgi:hypothetical protein
MSNSLLQLISCPLLAAGANTLYSLIHSGLVQRTLGFLECFSRGQPIEESSTSSFATKHSVTSFSIAWLLT